MTDLMPPALTVRTRPSWLSVMNLAAGIQVAVVLVGLVIWVTAKGDKADAVAAASIAINSRLDRLFDKVDVIALAMPVLQEKVTSLESQVTDGRGAYATLDIRLRAIENNEAANHRDASAALGRKP